MKPLLLSLFLLAAAASAPAQIQLSAPERDALGKKIWQNECAGTVSGLTSWNSGEDFPSLGIGHFIWYPVGKRGPFEESFPGLVKFLMERGKKPPAFVVAALPKGCPWPNRAAFEAIRNGAEVTALRQFLASTVSDQTDFLIGRFNAAVPKLLAAAPSSERKVIAARIQAVGSSSRGAFALVDYVNFKGEGLSPTERYKGEGWGLLQVLEAMKGKGDPVEDFSQAAETVLTRRVKNSPPERNEQRWLAGWANRVNRY